MPKSRAEAVPNQWVCNGHCGCPRSPSGLDTQFLSYQMRCLPVTHSCISLHQLPLDKGAMHSRLHHLPWVPKRHPCSDQWLTDAAMKSDPSLSWVWLRLQLQLHCRWISPAQSHHPHFLANKCSRDHCPQKSLACKTLPQSLFPIKLI